jgi:hypothetical protein
MTTEQADQSKGLLAAAAADDAARIVELLAEGADIEAVDDDGRSPLLLATRHNAIEAARALVDAGADVNAMDANHDSPFLCAATEGHLDILRMTLNSGADLDSVDANGGIALNPAAHNGHVATVHELLKTKINLNHVNNAGWTALLEAIIEGDGGTANIEIVRLLIEAGADVNIVDEDGVTALTHARDNGHAEIVEMLRAAGANEKSR